MQRSTWKTRGNEYGAFTRNETNVTSYYQQQPRRQMNRYAPYQKPIQGYPSEGPTKISNVTFQSNVHSSSIGELIGQTDLSPDQSRISCLPSDLKTVKDTIASIQGAAYHLPADLQHGVVADVLEKRIRHRERSRINQARYRERQKQVETKIGDAIVKLISEIEDLETKCKYYVYFSPTPTRWALASEYFRQLNNYLSSPVRLIKLSSKFLREVLAPDVMDGSRFGVDAQLENWILFVLYFDNVCVDLKGLKRPSPDTVVASTVTSVTITSKTLRRVFPHLNSDGVSGTKEAYGRLLLPDCWAKTSLCMVRCPLAGTVQRIKWRVFIRRLTC
ncbi:hypothetical protein PC128_g19943 [Phytophthora cactorum]|nr:hypothetical protein PC128_g19943 [Phytophthora cactorum]